MGLSVGISGVTIGGNGNSVANTGTGGFRR